MADNIAANEYCGYLNLSGEHKLIITGIKYSGKTFIKLDKYEDFTQEDIQCLQNVKIRNIDSFYSDNSDILNCSLFSFILYVPDNPNNNEYIIKSPKIYTGRQLEQYASFARVSPAKKVIVKAKQEDTKKAFIERVTTTILPQKTVPISEYCKLLPDKNAIKNLYIELSDLKKNAYICILSVEPDWLHYNDYVEHGLVEFWDFSFEHKDDSICVLVFQNLNVTLPRAGLTPLMDVLQGQRPQLPFSKYTGIPNNINIRATLLSPLESKQLPVPLDKDFFNNWGIQSNDGNNIESIYAHFGAEE